jgi:hypothetical protein
MHLLDLQAKQLVLQTKRSEKTQRNTGLAQIASIREITVDAGKTH